MNLNSIFPRLLNISLLLLIFQISSSTLLVGQLGYNSWVKPPFYRKFISLNNYQSKDPMLYAQSYCLSWSIEPTETHLWKATWNDLTFLQIKGLRCFDMEEVLDNPAWLILLQSPKLSHIEISMGHRDTDKYAYSFENPNLQKSFFEPLGDFKQLEYLRINKPDTSQAFINYLSQFPNLKVLEWVGQYKKLDFSVLTNLDTLVLIEEVTWQKEAETGQKLKLPKQLKALILPTNSLEWIWPTLRTHPTTLPYLEVRYEDSDSTFSLALLKDKVEHLSLRASASGKKGFPSANSTLQSLTIKSDFSYYKQYLRAKTISIDSTVAQFKQLKELDLGNYHAVNLPIQFYSLKQLEKLKVKTNELSDSIQYWKNLRELEVSGTKLDYIPPSLGNLTTLEILKIGSPKIKKFPNFIYQLTNLKQLSLSSNTNASVSQRQFRGIKLDSLAKLKKLTHFKITLNSIKSRAHLRNIYKALPESTIIELQPFDFKTEIQTPFNLGVYAQYSIEGAFRSGLELNFFYNPFKIASKFTKKGSFIRSAYGENNYATNPFDFHTFTAGVEWNYLKSFLMGYKIGYTYTRKRFPIAFQADVTAYTDYKGSFDLRITPQIGVPIKINFAYLYLMYGYKIPIIPNQELSLVPRHTISLTMRLVSRWPSLPAPAFIW